MTGTATSLQAPIAIGERLAFMGIDDNARAQLRKLKPLVDMAIGGALDAFYSKVQAAMHTRKFLSDIQHMEAAKARQKTLVHRHRVGVQRGLCQCCARRR